MENTRPEEAFIDGVKYTDNSWGGLLVNAVNYIIKKNYLTKEQLLGFNVHWYNKTLFSEIQLTNFRELDNGLFINANLGSLRSYWFLCDIIYYASIQLNDCYIIVKRFGIAEPKEVQEYVINNNLCLYHKHLALKFNDDKTIERYVKNIVIDMELIVIGYLNLVKHSVLFYPYSGALCIGDDLKFEEILSLVHEDMDKALRLLFDYRYYLFYGIKNRKEIKNSKYANGLYTRMM